MHCGEYIPCIKYIFWNQITWSGYFFTPQDQDSSSLMSLIHAMAMKQQTQEVEEVRVYIEVFPCDLLDRITELKKCLIGKKMDRQEQVRGHKDIKSVIVKNYLKEE